MKQLLVLFLACILLFCVIRTDANCGGKACCRSKQAKEVPKSAITYEVYEDAPNCNRAFNDIQLAIDTAVTEVQPTKTKFVNILIYGTPSDTGFWTGVDGTDVITVPDYVYIEGIGSQVLIHASVQYNIADNGFFIPIPEYDDLYNEVILRNVHVKGPTNGSPFVTSVAKPALVVDGPAFVPIVVCDHVLLSQRDLDTPVVETHGQLNLLHSVTRHNALNANRNTSGEHFHLYGFGGVASYYSVHYWFSKLFVTKGPEWIGALMQHSMMHSHPVGPSPGQRIDKIVFDIQHPVTIPGNGLIGPWNENTCHLHSPGASLRFFRIGVNGTWGPIAGTAISGNSWQVSGGDVKWIENENPNFTPQFSLGDTFTSLHTNVFDFYGLNIDFTGGNFQPKDNLFPEVRMRQVVTYIDNSETIKLKRGTARLDGGGGGALNLTLVDADPRYESESLNLLDVSGNGHVVNLNGFNSETGAAITTVTFSGSSQCHIRLDNVDGVWRGASNACATVA